MEKYWNYEVIMCTTSYWIVNAFSSFIMVCVFLILATKTDKQIQLNIAKEIKVYGFKESDFKEQREKLKNLWLIVKCYLVIETYTLLITLGTFIRGNTIISDNTKYDPDVRMCNIITKVDTVDVILWAIRRLCKYTMWLFPIVKVFWPKDVKQVSFVDKLTPSEIE